MNGRNPGFDADVAPLLEAGKIIPPVPDVVRARALARASATAALADAPLASSRRFGGRRALVLAVAACLLLTVSTAGAVAILRALDSQPRSTSPSIGSQKAVPQPLPPVPPSAEALANQPATARSRDDEAGLGYRSFHVKRLGHATTPQESYRAELRLLQRAHTAYAGHDYGDALVVIAEHARRFPNGHLAEDREALRVKALIGAGRTEEANAAAVSFAHRFPRSVLLPRLAPVKDSP